MGERRWGSEVKFISIFSGIEAASVAWLPLGWECLALSEVEGFPSAVLRHHYPDTLNLGDMTKVDWGSYRGKCDVVIGGAPCQAFSVAGLRNSLKDERGNLTLEYIKAVDAIEPRYIVFENVPGILSTKDNAFGCFLAGIVGADAPLVSSLERGRWTDAGMVIGPKRAAAWRILDAQYFGLAQRRRRVFLVASPRNGANPAAVLFESKGLSGDTPPSRKEGERVAPCLSQSLKSSGGIGMSNQELFSQGGPGLPWSCYENHPTVAFEWQSGVGVNPSPECSGTLIKNQVMGLYQSSIVRRLTPREAERLQGFEDDYTLVPFRGKPACDGPRYKALGNSMATTVVYWLGKRIEAVEEVLKCK